MESIKDIFNKMKQPVGQPKAAKPVAQPKKGSENQAALAEMVLKAIDDGVVMTDKAGVIQFINPAAVTMTEAGSADQAIGLDYALVIKLESKEGRKWDETENPLVQAMKNNKPLEHTEALLVPVKSGKRIPVAITASAAEGFSQNHVITFRNITAELEEEGEQTEFISTASHEMRTPVATIDGYLSLALNPQTATLDERARGYLTSAQAASKHLGKLFQDLLDVTKLDDGKIRPKLVPVEMNSLVRNFTNDYIARAQEAKVTLTFGSDQPGNFDPSRHLDQLVYGFVDTDFMREIMDNLIENAIKYTPSGGSVYVNVRGDGDRVLINVTDTGIGISADDLTHIFQKFYRADNSDTREIGGTGLGLYIVKQRVEAMDGRIWAESGFGEGSTFFVSLPRLSQEEYDKQMIAVQNQQLQPKPVAAVAPAPAPVPVAPAATTSPVTPIPNPAPVASAAPAATTAQPAPAAAPAPVTTATPAATSTPVTAPAPTAPTPVPAATPAATPQPQPAAQPQQEAQPQPAPQPQPQPAPSIQPSSTNNNNLNGEAK